MQSRCSSLKVRTWWGSLGFISTAFSAQARIPTPVVALSFDENSGTVAASHSHHALTGTLTNGATWATGVHGSAVALDGKQQQYVELHNVPLNTAVSFTVTAWVKLSNLDGWQTFVSQPGQAVNRFALQKRGDNGHFGFTLYPAATATMPAPTAQSDFTPTPDLWYQLTGVYDKNAKQIRLYANGALLAATAMPVAADIGMPGVIELGRGLRAEDPTDYVTGAIDETRLYNLALTGAEVNALYQADLAAFRPHTFTWANPIYFQGNGHDTDIHDPDIIQDGGMYYAVATLAPFRNFTDRDPKLPDLGSAPGIAIYESPDLKAWKFASWLLKSSDLPDNVPYKHQFWAPEIHKFNGRYYVIFGGSNWIDDKYNINGRMGYYQFIGVADKITGPYKHFTALKGPGVDTSLFQDDDGKTYVVWPGNEIHPIDLSHIDEDKITVGDLVGRASTSEDFKAQGKPVPNTIEGPYMIKHDGTYYCFFAETYPDLYATGIAMSKNLAGPWHLDPRWRVFPGGHQALFTGPDGRWWTAYKHERTPTVPWLSVDPIDFDAAGNIQVNLTTGPQQIMLPR